MLGKSCALLPSPTPTYLADTGGTLITSHTEHSPVCVPPAVEIASHCRGERERQLKRKGNSGEGGALGKLTLPPCPPAYPTLREPTAPLQTLDKKNKLLLKN